MLNSPSLSVPIRDGESGKLVRAADVKIDGQPLKPAEKRKFVDPSSKEEKEYDETFMVVMSNGKPVAVDPNDDKTGVTGGLAKATTYDIKGKGKLFDLGGHPGKTSAFGISSIRHGLDYEKTTLFAGYPVKRNWYPLSSDIYEEIISSIGDAYPYPVKALFLYLGAPTYALTAGHTNIEILIPIRGLTGKEPTDLRKGHDLALITHRVISQTKSRMIANPWLSALLPENGIPIHPSDASRIGITNGQKVKVVSATKTAGEWDLGGGRKKPTIGRAVVTQTIRPGVVSFYDTHVTLVPVI